MKWTVSLFWVVFFSSGTALFADTLYKKNGEILRNVKIVGQTRMQVRYRKADSEKIKYIAKSQLRRITYQKVDEKEAAKEEERKKRARERREKKRRAALAEKRRKAAALRRKRAAARRAHGRLQQAIRRNIVLPGWGQWHLGQKTRGAIFGGAFVATAGFAYQASQDLQNATRSYLDPVPFALLQSNSNGLLIGNLIYSQRGAEVEAAGARLNQSLLLLTLIWAGGFLDLSYARGGGGAPVSPKKKKRKGGSKGVGKHLSMGFFALPPLSAHKQDRGSLGFTIQMRF